MATDTLSDQTRVVQRDLKGTPEFLRMLRAMQARLKTIEDDYLSTSSTGTLTNKTLSSFTNTVDADSLHIQVRNISGGTIAKGVAVYLNGYDAGSGLMKIGVSDNTNPVVMPAIGVTTAEIAHNANGSVCFIGRVTGLDTSLLGAGQVLYVGTAGTLVTTPPVLPNYRQKIGTVLKSNATTGIIEIAAEPNTADPLGTRYDDNTPTGFIARNDSSGAAAYSHSVIRSFGNAWGMRTGSTAANANAWELVLDPLGAATVRAKCTTAGAFSIPGNFAFNGKTPIASVAAPTAAGAAYGATEQALLNDIRTRLVNLGVYT